MLKHFFATVLLFMAPILSATGAVYAASASQAPAYIKLTPNQAVNNPTQYLNKKIEITGKFDKFTTLGLDYKKAMKPSTTYISFLMQRDDVKDHNVPLSELKLFVKREYAEKFIDLNTSDTIKVKGTMFSTALGDAWAEIDSIEVISKAQTNDKKENGN